MGFSTVLEQNMTNIKHEYNWQQRTQLWIVGIIMWDIVLTMSA